MDDFAPNQKTFAYFVYNKSLKSLNVSLELFTQRDWKFSKITSKEKYCDRSENLYFDLQHHLEI